MLSDLPSADTGGREPPSRVRVLAIASGGGHWVQLLRMLPAFAAHDVTFVSTLDYHDQVGCRRFYTVADASRWSKLSLIRLAFSILWIMLRERPDVVISTGAAPGYFAIRIGRLFGARTIWVDSFANAEELSLSGQMAGPHAHLWLTQWEHLSSPDGPEFAGSVL